MMNLTFTKTVVITFCASAFIVLAGCEKDKETIATITVVNEDGVAVPGAQVRLFSEPSTFPPPAGAELRFDTLGTTNATGKVTFNFSEFYKKGQAGFAVLDIQVCKGSQAGVGIIKIAEEETTEEKIVVEPGACAIPEEEE